ncbi:hypothetical protein EJ08DRAFT_699677 [Tothia fuscella]|uniref:Uncharacterized protein n=1 Tax=Tothia fuscella TaxID=1048955 RepID=A0A9P4NLG6_9PEZI|nr:hypothetical protein EJ08DRAFT_699677 [Tothia fuscella]
MFIRCMIRPEVFRQSHRSTLSGCLRGISTLPNNPHIYYFPDPSNPSRYTLSYLPTEPPVYSLCIGQTSTIPPTDDPTSFTTNPKFLSILQSVIAANATSDPIVQAASAAYASQAGSSLGSGGFLFPSNHPSSQQTSYSSATRRSRAPGIGTAHSDSPGKHAPTGSGAGPTASQGGMGSGGRGGYVHVSDLRRPPDFGRIADPEDIFGSVEVDSTGSFVGERGGYQESGTYRAVTREGILGLSDFLRGKLVERLKELEGKERS